MEEISLKEILTILLKGYKTIVICVTCAAFVAFGIGLTKPKVYTSSSILKANDINLNPAVNLANNPLSSGVSPIIQVPIINIDSYTQLIQNKKVLDNVIAEMDIKNSEGAPAESHDIAGNIHVTADKATGMINVSVTSSGSQYAADLANALSNQFILYLNEVVSKSCDSILSTINTQLAMQQEKIDSSAQKLKAYHESPYNPLEMETSITNLIIQIATYRMDLNDLTRFINADQLALSHMRTAGIGSSATNFNINSNININSEDAISPGIEITFNPDSDIESAILSIKKAETEARLIQNLSDLEALQNRLQSMEADLTQLEITYATELQKYNSIQTDYQIAGDTYTLYQRMQQQMSIIASSDIVRKNITILSEAFAEHTSQYVNLPLYIAVGITLGLFIGIFIVLFRNYWTTTTL